MQQFGAAPRCPRCADRVYAAEKVLGPASTAYHRQCLRCIVCDRRLDSVSLLEHDAQPFCSACHRTHLGTGGGTFGTAVPLRPRIDTAATAQAAAAETQQPAVAPSRSAQRLADRAVPAAAPAPPPARAQAATAPSSAVSGTPRCARCAQPVYFAEQRQACGHKWHRACLRCDGCRATLDPGKVQDGPADATDSAAPSTWCRNCYARRFGPRGIGVAGTSFPR